MSPPDEAQAEEFKITYDPEYWGTDARIYGTFGKGDLQGHMSMETPIYPVYFVLNFIFDTLENRGPL